MPYGSEEAGEGTAETGDVVQVTTEGRPLSEMSARTAAAEAPDTLTTPTPRTPGAPAERPADQAEAPGAVGA